MALQLSASFTQLGLLLKDISDVSDATKLQWSQFISDYIYKEISMLDPERFIASTTVSVTAGTNSYSLPGTFFHARSEGTGLYQPDSNGNATDNRFPLTGFGSPINGFYISGSDIVLTPPNYPNSDTLTFRYIPNPFTYTALTEYYTDDGTNTGVDIIPSIYSEYIVKALHVLYTQFDENPSDESFSDARFVRALNDLLKNIPRQGRAYAMPDISSIF